MAFENFKDFESVRLKATLEIEVGGRKIMPGETIAYFDRIQIAGLNEVKKLVTANGGFDNRSHVFWHTTQEAALVFSQGVFSREQLALLMDAKLAKETNEPLLITEREFVETDGDGKVTLKHLPEGKVFVYRQSTATKLPFTISGKELTLQDPYKDIIVDYEYGYTGGFSTISIGARLLEGFMSLEGRTRVKDDTTGKIATGIIKIPKLKLMSEMSLRLGSAASPQVGGFTGAAIPVGSRDTAYVCRVYFLNDDISGDIE